MQYSHGLLNNFLGKVAGWAARSFTIASVLLLGKPGDSAGTENSNMNMEGGQHKQSIGIGGQLTYIHIGHTGDENHIPPRPE